MLALVDPDQLPKCFRCPPGLLDLLKLESIYFGPWQILQGELLLMHHLMMTISLASMFPIFEPADHPRVRIIHDFCSPDWAGRGGFGDFDAWLVSAKAEAAEWDE
jgi:hypothetical protein